MTSRESLLQTIHQSHAGTVRGRTAKWIVLLLLLPLLVISGELVLSRAIHGTGVIEELTAFGWSYAYLFSAVLLAVAATGAVLSRFSSQPMRSGTVVTSARE